MAQPLGVLSRSGEGHVARLQHAAVTVPLGLPNIINDNVSDFLAAMFLGQKVLSKCGCSDFGKVLVFRNGEHFLFGQAT